MRARSLLLAALGGILAFGSIAPAQADRDGWRRHEWRERGWDGGGRHRHYRPYAPPVYYPAPVIVAPPAYRYYAPPPPPVYYGNPGVSFGFSFR
jgi:hypothetical protein